MKLVGKLKEKVEKSESKEEAKELIKEAGVELTDDELGMVSGGLYDPFSNAGAYDIESSGIL